MSGEQRFLVVGVVVVVVVSVEIAVTIARSRPLAESHGAPSCGCLLLQQPPVNVGAPCRAGCEAKAKSTPVST
jgi:hypothetical protein